MEISKYSEIVECRSRRSEKVRIGDVDKGREMVRSQIKRSPKTVWTVKVG